MYLIFSVWKSKELLLSSLCLYLFHFWKKKKTKTNPKHTKLTIKFKIKKSGFLFKVIWNWKPESHTYHNASKILSSCRSLSLKSCLQCPKVSTVVILVSNPSLITNKFPNSWMMEIWNPGPWPRNAHLLCSKWLEVHNIFYRIHIYLVKFTIGHKKAAYFHFPTYRERRIDFFLGTLRLFLCMANLLCSIGGCSAFPGMKN